jgi:hypothetical protein
MTSRRTPRRPTLRAADYPTLESFCGGYLHEDFVAEYGSASKALDAFRADASPQERGALEREADLLLKAAATVPFDTVAEFIRRDLGAAWRPADLKALQRLLKL